MMLGSMTVILRRWGWRKLVFFIQYYKFLKRYFLKFLALQAKTTSVKTVVVVVVVGVSSRVIVVVVVGEFSAVIGSSILRL